MTQVGEIANNLGRQFRLYAEEVVIEEVEDFNEALVSRLHAGDVAVAVAATSQVFLPTIFQVVAVVFGSTQPSWTKIS